MREEEVGRLGRSVGRSAVGPLGVFVRPFVRVRPFLSDFDAQSLSSPISTTTLILIMFFNAADVATSTGSEEICYELLKIVI